MSDSHTIPDEIAARVSRLINAAEDMRQQATDDLKQIYADLRDDLKGLGWAGTTISSEVAAFKGAIVEMRLDDEKKSKRDEKSERIDDYVSMLSRARARESRSYADAKGRTESGPEVQVRDEVASSGAERTEGCYGTPARSVSDEILSANPPSASAPHTGLSSFPEHEVDASSGSIQSPAPTSSQAGDSAGEGVLPLSPASHSNEAIPHFLRRGAAA